MTSSGAVLPSYDIESRRDAYDESELRVVQVVTLVMCIYFAFTEVNEACVLGLLRYFSNMWNFMDCSNFVLYGLLYHALDMTRWALEDTECSTICMQVGLAPRDLARSRPISPDLARSRPISPEPTISRMQAGLLAPRPRSISLDLA